MHTIVDEMPLEELRMWQLWMGEPRGEARADWHSAQISQMINQVAGLFSKNSRNLPTKDFLLDFSGGVKHDPVSQILSLQKIFRVIPKKDLKQACIQNVTHEDEIQVYHPKKEKDIGTMVQLKKSFGIED